MTDKRQSVSHSETKRYLDHACTAQGGRTNAYVADLLELPASRISVGRQGKWGMTERHKDIIIERFGTPKGRPGTYVQAETHDSLADFFAQNAQLSRRRHLYQIAQCVNTPGFKQALAGAIEWADEPSMKIDGEGRPDNAETRAERLDRLDALMALPEFQIWLTGATKYLGRLCEVYDDPGRIFSRMGMTEDFDVECIQDLPMEGDPVDLPYERSLKELAHDLGIRIRSWSLFPTLYVLGHLRHSTDMLADATGWTELAPYHPRSGIAVPAPSVIDDYVITGSCVYELEGRFSTPWQGEPCLSSIFQPAWRDQPHRGFALTFDRQDQYTPDTPARSVAVDYWITFRVAVFLKEDCNYALQLRLSDVDVAGSMSRYRSLGRYRNIVIPDIAALELFKTLETLRKWLGLPELDLLELKSQVAQEGGYIPGARVI